MARPKTGEDETDAAVVIGIIVFVVILLIAAFLVVGGSAEYFREQLSHGTPVGTPSP